MRSLRKFTSGVLVALGASASLVKTAAAAPCSSLGLDHPVYGSGGSAITADLKGVAVALAGLADPITILYADQGGACTGYQWFVDDAITGVFKYWDAAGNQYTCDPPILGQAADFAHMGNPVTECPDAGDPSGHKNLPAGIKDFKGPVQTLNIITDKDSAETSISEEALYFIYGFGAGSTSSEVEPWLTTAYVAQRQPTAFVSLFLGKAIGVDPTAFVAYTPVFSDQTAVINYLRDSGVTAPDATLGYVSGSAADARRADVKTLAYQDSEQERAYWPDSDENSLDKINVRKGLYALWTPGHFFARATGNSVTSITNDDVKNLIGWFRGEIESPAGINIPQLVSQAGDVPLCAMYATRDGLTGAISSYASPDPCHCFFEVSNGEGESCEACEDNDDCGGDTPACRHGYCEAY